MGSRVMPVLILLGLGLVVVFNSIFIVSETQRAVMLKFGEIVKTDIQPGFHWKMPIVNNIRKFDARILTVDAPPERFITSEKKAVMVDSYIKWRIDNVDKYYTSTSGEERRANGLLAQRVNDGLRKEFGLRTVADVVSGERDELMFKVMKDLDILAREELGVEIIDIRVKQIDLPEEVSNSVYNRMRSERQREAREHRSEGNEIAEGIRAAADREKVVIESAAYRDAETLRGEGDARAAEIYANAFNRDAEFYSFMRSLQAYEASFADKADVLLVDPSGDYFRYLQDASGGRESAKQEQSR